MAALSVIVVLAGASAGAGCGTDPQPPARGDAAAAVRLDVVASTPVAGDIARQVGGTAVRVRTLVAVGADPHTYEPRPSDAAGLAAADVIVLSGLGLDDWARELIRASGSSAPVIDLAAGIPVRRAGQDGANADPHWWHDPVNDIAATRQIERALVAARPRTRPAIAASARSYRVRLAALDRSIATCLRGLVPRERKLVTNHDALGYFADRYGLAVVGAVIPSQSTGGQASAGELARLERTIEQQDVRAVFPEESLSPKLARQIARVTGASAELRLYGDALGAHGSGAETLRAMLATNTERIARGLSGGRVRCVVRA